MLNILRSVAAGSALVAAATFMHPLPAAADTTSAIVSAASAIVGALLVDANNRPYYVQESRRYYVTPEVANYWRSHHHVVQRNAWVPENEYPVERNGGYREVQQNNDRDRGQSYHNQDRQDQDRR